MSAWTVKRACLSPGALLLCQSRSAGDRQGFFQCTFSSPYMPHGTPAPIMSASASALVTMVCAACGAPGLLARMSTQLAREREESARLAEEETDFERIVSMGLGPLDALDPEQEVGGLFWLAWSERYTAENDEKGTRVAAFLCFTWQNEVKNRRKSRRRLVG